jgi:uncharacterized lipoprotein
MKSVIAAVLLVLVLSGCSDPHKMTECRGTYAPANPGKWQPTPQDLRS